jgi:NAD(P)-dependent dehydrogenase (short-subunit alcohol dehydrogenase family)
VTVLITGASTGIGKAAALYLAQKGWQVLAGVRKVADAEALRRESLQNLIPLYLDITDQTQIKNAVEVVSQVGDLTGLVNNAGIAIAGPLEFVPLEEIRRQFEVNIIGHIAVTQAMLPFIRKTRGRIVFVGSIGGRSSFPFFAPYNASKYALEAITDALRVELRPWKIHVSIVEPGVVETPIWKNSLATGASSLAKLPPDAHHLYGPAIEWVQRLKNVRGVPPEPVAHAIEHALTAKHPRNRYVIGKDAYWRLALEALPDFLRDWLIARYLPPYGQKTPLLNEEGESSSS